LAEAAAMIGTFDSDETGYWERGTTRSLRGEPVREPHARGAARIVASTISSSRDVHPMLLAANVREVE